jgi:predicted permease
MASDFTAELRHAVRALLRAPTLTLAAVVCLGLGIGATTAIYSAVHTALLRSLPFDEPDRLVSVFRTTPHFSSGPFAPANFIDLRSATRSLEGLAAIATNVALLEGTDESQRVSVGQASGDLFPVLRVPALRGRLLRPEDEGAEAPLVAVVTEELWRDRFGADAGLVGSTLRLDGQEHDVVGILPAELRIPHGSQAVRADVWTPLRFTPQEASQRRSNYLRTVARLVDGTSPVAADGEMVQIMEGIIEAHPELRGEQLRVVPMQAESVKTVRGPLLLLLGAVGFVLLIAAANVASLLLARGVGRREEYAVRTALGARRADLIRTALLESALLAAFGSVVGLALAWAGVSAIRSLLPTQLPQLSGLSVDLPILGFALVLAAAVASLCAVAPAWQASSGDTDALRSGGRSGTGSRHQRWLRSLIVAEVALSLMLLLGAGLVMRGFQSLVGRDPGFAAEGLVTLSVDVSPSRYEDVGTYAGFLAQAVEAVRGVPGVTQAGAIQLIPYEGWGWNFNIRYEGQAGDDPTRLPLVENRYVSPGIFATLGQTLLGGRLLSEMDDASEGTPVVVVANQALVDRDFAGEDPVGKRFHLSDSTYATIVGVVTNIRNSGPYSEPRPAVYWSYAQRGGGFSSFPLLIRTSGDPLRVSRAVTAAIRTVDPTAAVSQPRTMDQVMARSVGRPRFYLALLGIFAGVALGLAVSGLYGIMSYAVARRTRELGVRAALGGTPTRIFSMVMAQGMGLLVIGSAAGLLGGVAVTRLLGSLLYGVSPLDAVTWLLVPLPLVGAAALATVIPARRASAVSPSIAMREE